MSNENGSAEVQVVAPESVPAAQAAPAGAAQPLVIDVNNVTAAQRLAILRSVHGFFANYDRVPGGLASQWGNALDALAVVINSETQTQAKAASLAAAAQ